MQAKPTVLAICGSTRSASTNHQLIKAFAHLNEEQMTITVFDGIANLPHFNPDLDHEDAPADVARFRQQIRMADAVLICTPEYAVGVPGTLKNAIDWTVSSMDFSQKPVALITASVSGKAAHASLLGTLLIIESRMTEATQLLIPFAKTKVNMDGRITDPTTLNRIQKLSESLLDLIQEKDDALLKIPRLRNDGINSGA